MRPSQKGVIRTICYKKSLCTQILSTNQVMLACLLNSHYQYVAIFGIAIILLISETKSDLWSVVPITHAQVSKDKVVVMYDYGNPTCLLVQAQFQYRD